MRCMATALALFLVAAAAGCSKEATKAAVYESVRFKSNEINAGDPNHDPDSVPGYEEYRRQRDEYYEERETERER